MMMIVTLILENSDSDGFSVESDSHDRSDSEDGEMPSTGRPTGASGGGAGWTFFTWSAGEDFVPNNYTFDDTSSGIHDTANMDEDSKVLDYFELFCDEELVQCIVQETNNL